MTWIIGDIHGCADELNRLLAGIDPYEKLVFVGDYIDRGPDSRGVVERVLQEKDRSTFLKGNHEDMMLGFFKHGAMKASAWIMENNGGRDTLKSYGLGVHAKWEDLPESHRQFFQNLVLFYEEDDFAVVHAGVDTQKGTNLNTQSRDDLIWIRSKWINREKSWTGKYIYYGHTPVVFITGESSMQTPYFGRNSCGLDTGCVYGGYLTAVHHPSREVLQVKSSFRWA